MFQKPLERLTKYTITDPNVLLKELEEIKALGYRIVRGEYKEKNTSIAVPIKNYKGNVIAAINIVGPSIKYSIENQIHYKFIARGISCYFKKIRLSANLAYGMPTFINQIH